MGSFSTIINRRFRDATVNCISSLFCSVSGRGRTFERGTVVSRTLNLRCFVVPLDAQVWWLILVRDDDVPVHLNSSNVESVEFAGSTAVVCCPSILEPGWIVHALGEIGHILFGVMTKVIIIPQRL